MSQNKTRAEILSEEPFSLSLSSGFFGYFSHLGFVHAFDQKKLKPQLLSGSSAGSLVAAGLASGKSAKELSDIFLSIQKDDFWDPKPGLGYLSGEKVEQLLQQYCCQAFSDTRIPLRISVFNIQKMRTETYSQGSVAKACRASASVPILFHPVKMNGHYFYDGGILDRAGYFGCESSQLRPVIHYLHSNNIFSKIEDYFFYQKLHSQNFFIKIKNPYKIGPNCLENGQDIINYFYKQTTLWLEEKIVEKID